MFYYSTSFHGYGIENWNTSNVIDMSSMFEGTILLYDANLSKWDVSNVRKMTQLFCQTRYYTGIGLDIWNTSSVNDMPEIFNDKTNMYETTYYVRANKSLWNVSKFPPYCKHHIIPS